MGQIYFNFQTTSVVKYQLIQVDLEHVGKYSLRVSFLKFSSAK